MAIKQEIILVFKPKGMTMGELVEDYKHRFPDYKNVPITYAGRLDPMAEGLVILLSGDAVHRKFEFLNLDKEYEFDFVLGFKTDTYDALGLVIDLYKDSNSIDENLIYKTVLEIKNITSQEYPPFSSKPVLGKPLFEWARKFRLDEINIPSRSVVIKNLETLAGSDINGMELLEKILKDISLVQGDFRQEEIQKRWKVVLSGRENQNFRIIRAKALVSSGTYIRGIVNEIGERLGVGAVTLSIKRTRIGEYDIKSTN